MALSQSDLDALDKAIASAELEVEVDGRRVRYRSVQELQSARNHVATVLQANSSAGRPRASYQFSFTTQRGD